MTESAPDTRNLHWKNNNVGSTMLQKMGWKHGQGLGKRRRGGGAGSTTSQNVSDEEGNSTTGLQAEEEPEVSSEGLKIRKRRDGLGLGANHQVHQETTGHDHFSEILQSLNQEHGSSNNNKKKKKKSKRKSDSDDNDDEPKRKKSKKDKKQRETILPTNKMTHSRVRQAKFAAKTSEDMACIFGKGAALPPSAAVRVLDRGSIAGSSGSEDGNGKNGARVEASKDSRATESCSNDDKDKNSTDDNDRSSERKVKDKERKRSKRESKKSKKKDK